MLDQLGKDQPNFADRITAAHTQFDGRALSVATTIGGIGAPAQSIQGGLTNITSAAGQALTLLQAVQQHGAPIAQTWIGTFRQIDACAKAIDSVLDPLSYLLKAAGCTDTDVTAAKGTMDLRPLAQAAAQTVGKALLALIQDVLSGLPTFLEGLTVDALGLTPLSAALDAASTGLPGQTTALSQATAGFAPSLATIAASAPSSLTYPCVDPRTGKPLQIPNAFFDTASTQSLAALIASLLGEATARARPLPDASPLVISWRTPA